MKYILGIETSCDETSLAIIDEYHKVIKLVVYSQIDTHQATSGVVPEIAAREHATKIYDVMVDMFKDLDIALDDIDIIAVAQRPGLIGSLLVGLVSAEVLSLFLQKPLVYVDHIFAHVCSNWLDRNIEDFKYPIICLTVSGGHNDMYLIQNDITKNIPQKIGHTLDDAAGECFDKVAKMLKIGYPGGPVISKYAKYGDRDAINLPKAMINSGDLNFSFSGIKNAARLWIEKNSNIIGSDRPKHKKMMSDFCASFEKTIADIFVSKIGMACNVYNAKEIHIAGGVSANTYIGERISDFASKMDLDFKSPVKKIYSTDNGAMIAVAGLFSLQEKIN